MNSKLLILALVLNLSLSWGVPSISRGIISNGLVNGGLIGLNSGLNGGLIGLNGGLIRVNGGLNGGLIGLNGGLNGGLIGLNSGLNGGLIGLNSGLIGVNRGLVGGLIGGPRLVGAPVIGGLGLRNAGLWRGGLVGGGLVGSGIVGGLGGLRGYTTQGLLSTYRLGGLGLNAIEGLNIASNLRGAYTQYTGPVNAAIETIRTQSVIDVPTSQDVIQPTNIIVEPNVLPVNIEFRSQSSPVNPTQVHIPGRPGTLQETQSEEEPDVLRHEVVKPIVQEVRETIVPFRRITQEVLPVQEEVHSVTARGQNQKVVAEQQLVGQQGLIGLKSGLIGVNRGLIGVNRGLVGGLIGGTRLVGGPVVGGLGIGNGGLLGGGLVGGGVVGQVVQGGPVLTVAQPALVAQPVLTGILGQNSLVQAAPVGRLVTGRIRSNGGLIGSQVISSGQLINGGDLVAGDGGPIAGPGQIVGTRISRFGSNLPRNLELIKARS